MNKLIYKTLDPLCQDFFTWFLPLKIVIIIHHIERLNYLKMSEAKFVHLRNHTAYSLAEGAIKIPKMLDMCKVYDMPAVAMTDTANMFGGMELCFTAAKEGIQPIMGCNIRVKTDKNLDSLVLIAQNDQGYQNLIKIVSYSYEVVFDNELPHISHEYLKANSDGIICLSSGPMGRVGRLLIEKRKPEAEAYLVELHSIFKDRLYIELMRHSVANESITEQDFLDFAYKYNIPLVATNDCYFLTRDMHIAHDALLCIAGGKYIIDDNRRKVTEEHYFKSSREMIELFKDLPEAIENTINIAKRCSHVLTFVDPILPKFETEKGETEEEAIQRITEEGLLWRLEKFVYTDEDDETKKLDIKEKYFKRMEYELGILLKMGFAGYFLIVADFIQWSKDNDIPVGPGRGSGAGSVVAWAMKITDLDPLRFDLLFERFLNPERISMPDFDIDFCQENRDKVIEYVQNKYGKDRVAQIITFGKLQPKAVVRDVGRVLQMPYGQVDKIAKLIPNNPNNPMTLQESLDSEPDLREIRRTDETASRLIDMGLQLEGLYRHASTHAAGVVIGDRPLDELVPMYKDPRSDMPVTQFNMKYVEQAGLIKFDFLGLKTLTVIKHAIDIIRETTGDELDPLTFPLDDKKTFDMLARGECVSVFQLESSGMQDLCKQMGVDHFEQIIAIVALYRPGPMENIPKYIACLKGEEEQDFMHPKLEPVLRETYGVMIYQEQVMQAAQVLAGYSLGDADILRKAMGKKIKAEMDSQKDIFVDGCVKNGVDKDQSVYIFEQIAKFASYGFNKAHSAAYALIAYQTAFLKANYPVEFMAATMTYDMGNTDKLGMLRQELINMGIELKLPNINKSGVTFIVEKDKDGKKSIRYALGALKGSGEQAMHFALKERAENGDFKDLFDFIQRVDSKTINKRQMEALSASGAFDCLNDNRAEVFASIEILLKYANSLQQEKDSGQTSLFGGDSEVEMVKPDLPKPDSWEPMELLKHEANAIGFYLSAHPLDTMSTQLKRLKVVQLIEIEEKLRENPTSIFKMAGVVIRKQIRVNKKGNKFAFAQISDTSGVFEVMMFSEVLSASMDYLNAGTAVAIGLSVSRRDGELSFLASKIELLEDALASNKSDTNIYINKIDAVKPLKELIQNNGKGKSKISLIVDNNENEEIEISIPGEWLILQEHMKSYRKIDGVQNIVVI